MEKVKPSTVGISRLPIDQGGWTKSRGSMGKRYIYPLDAPLDGMSLLFLSTQGSPPPLFSRSNCPKQRANMATFTKLWLGLLYLTAAVTAIPVQRQDGPPLPSEDPWYLPTEDYESAAPGDILKKREVPYPIAAFNEVKVNIASAHHLMYRSHDNFGNPAVAVTTVLVPHDADNNKILSYQVAEDSASPNCAPSYALQKGHTDLGISATQAEFLLMIAGLSNGWVVTVPDFEGLQGAFLANNRAGFHTLDGIRATLNTASFTNISRESKIAMWGYSGGSLASGFAAELHPIYAPELNIVGAALGGTVPTIYPVMDMTNESPHAGLIAAGIVGLTHEYPEAKILLDEQLIPETRDYFMQAADQCLGKNSETFNGKDMYSYFKDPDLFKQKMLQDIMNENSMGHNIPTIPLMVYKADKDEVSTKEDTMNLVGKYCRGGTIVHLNRDGTSDHTNLAIVGAPDALIWLKDRFMGVENESQCTEDWEWVSILDPKALGVLGKVLFDALFALMGGPIDPWR